MAKGARSVRWCRSGGTRHAGSVPERLLPPRARAWSHATRAQNHVLSICVEVCSAALYFENDAGVLISACIFGDGAGAAILSNIATGKRGIEWKTSGSFLAPNDRDLLRFEQKAGMLRNVLTPEVPALAAKHAARVFEDVLTRANVTRGNVKGWLLHPGGRDVLLALQESLGISQHALRGTRLLRWRRMIEARVIC